MARIVVLGGGVCGLAAAVMLSRDGHEVTVVERDGGRVPSSPTESWEDWDRRGIAQFRQPHWLQPAGARVLDEHLPEVRDALLAAGGQPYSPLELMPPTITDRAPRPDDARFTTVTARRPVLEYAFAGVAEQVASVRRGTAVAGLLRSERTALPGVPHIAGVVTADGEKIEADLVVDASGRRSALSRWLADQGARPVGEESGDAGFYYYTRYFAGSLPRPRTGLLCPVGSISILTLPGDSGTWSVTVFVSAGDSELRAVRRTDAWMRVVRACPLHEHWLDGEPLTEVLAMGGALGHHRQFGVDGEPVATGVVAVGDALLCTNPSLGRGISLGLGHVAELSSVVRDHIEAPAELGRTWLEVVESRLAPWYRVSVEIDNDRYAQIAAAIAGRPAPAPVSPGIADQGTLAAAAMYDPELFRAYFEAGAALTLPGVVLGRPGVLDRARQVAAAHEPLVAPGPDRGALLGLIAA